MERIFNLSLYIIFVIKSGEFLTPFFQTEIQIEFLFLFYYFPRDHSS